MLPSIIVVAERGEMPAFTRNEKGFVIPRALKIGVRLSDSIIKVFTCNKNTYKITHFGNKSV